VGKFWQFRNQVGGSAELILYGDISDTSWWGDEVTPKQFAEDLNSLGAVTEITARINSGGGDVFAAQTIGNLLEQHSANVTARIDGLCASAATIIACHCNQVIAANDSTYMVHPVRMGLFGYADETKLRQYQNALAAIKESIIGLYVKKTGRSQEEVTDWMDATSWWTAAQAKENGFVDELTDNETDAVVENRSGVLFVNSVSMNLPFSKAPEFVQDSVTAPVPVGAGNKEGQELEIKSADDLRTAYPEFVGQIEQAAVSAERERIRGIEDMALPGSEDFTNEAKFAKPMCVSDFAVAMVKNAKAKGAAFLDGLRKDSEEGGAESLGSPPAPETENNVSAAIAQAKQDARIFLNGGKKQEGTNNG